MYCVFRDHFPLAALFTLTEIFLKAAEEARVVHACWLHRVPADPLTGFRDRRSCRFLAALLDKRYLRTLSFRSFGGLCQQPEWSYARPWYARTANTPENSCSVERSKLDTRRESTFTPVNAAPGHLSEKAIVAVVYFMCVYSFLHERRRWLEWPHPFTVTKQKQVKRALQLALSWGGTVYENKYYFLMN